MTIRIVTQANLVAKVHSEERIAGKRATFHVYHATKAAGLKRFDVSYAATAEEAAARTVSHYRNRVDVLFVVPVDQFISI